MHCRFLSLGLCPCHASAIEVLTHISIATELTHISIAIEVLTHISIATELTHISIGRKNRTPFKALACFHSLGLAMCLCHKLGLAMCLCHN